MNTSIHVYIPAAKEGMFIQIPKNGLEKIILQFRNWVEEHSNLGPQEKVTISVWGTGEHIKASSIVGFSADIEDTINVITGRVVR